MNKFETASPTLSTDEMSRFATGKNSLVATKRRWSKLIRLSGELSRRLTPTQIRQATITQIADTIGASASFASSALSGNVRAIAVGLYEEIEP